MKGKQNGSGEVTRRLESKSFKVRFWGGVMLIGRRNKGKWDVRNSKVTLIH